MKIHIIGCSGSGKTYLAKALSRKYKIPCFDLDDIQWDNSADSYGVKLPVEKRNALLKQILQNDSWIIEGVYYSWVGQSFEDADKIFVLDMPQYLYKSRILFRSVKRKLGFAKGKKETLKSVIALIKWTDTFQNKNLKEIKAILNKYNEKVVWLYNKKDVNEIINN
ncbi:MAG: DNA topology modulation protein FlaR [Clostridia bacterium]|nr:DNA topology modulation protein FlaR [Clostridia bacterium]